MSKIRPTPLFIPPFSDVYNITVPELLISALAQHAVVGGVSSYTETPIVYEKLDGKVKKVKGVETVQTRSTADNQQRWKDAFVGSFSKLGPHIAQDLDQIAAAVEDELWTRTGTESARTRRKVRAAVPVTPICAVLQNQIGMLGTSQYVDYGKAIESLYQVGKFLDGDTSDATAHEKLQKALADRTNQDSRLAALDLAFLASLCSAVNETVDSVSYDQIGGRLTLPNNSPHVLASDPEPNQVEVLEVLRQIGEINSYVWFYRSWNKLTDAAWYQALPHRRWVDWLVTVLRLSIGTAYLARSQWIISAAKYSLRPSLGNATASGSLIEDTFLQQPLIWPDRAGSSIGDRDVFPQVRKLIRTGISIRQVLEKDVFRSVLGDDESVENLAKAVKSNRDLAKRLEQALLTPTNALHHKEVQPVYNTVRDALVDRTGGDADLGTADNYAIIKKVGNAFILDPSSEVMALIATLACDQPDGFTSLGNVRREFQALGLRPSQNELRFLLERSGLCRSEADASLQVTVSSALRTASLL